MTQTELADRLLVSQSAISQWETGTFQITAEHVIGLERELGLRSGSLLLEAGYIDEGLLGVDAARRFALWKLQCAVTLLAGIGVDHGRPDPQRGASGG
jgi:transcriptional regulator with XRE-family HTH domain